jgi:hypothetical protein
MTDNNSDLFLDGNAAAGLLQGIFVRDITTAETQCAACGFIASVGSLRLYAASIGGGSKRLGNCNSCAQRRLAQVDKALLSPETDGRHASLRSRAAFSLRMSGRTSSLISIFSKSDNQRSGLIIGQSEPKSTFVLRSVLQYWTRIFGKYFGDQPERSM